MMDTDFQIIDIGYTDTADAPQPHITVYGIQRNGRNVAMRVYGSDLCCFYCRLPEAYDLESERDALERRLGVADDDTVSLTSVYRRDMADGGRSLLSTVEFLRVSTSSYKHLRQLAKSAKPLFAPREVNVQPSARFMQSVGVRPCEWVRVVHEGDAPPASMTVDEWQRTVSVLQKDITYAPQTILSFDIEVVAADAQSFPDAQKRGDRVIQIGTLILQDQVLSARLDCLGRCERPVVVGKSLEAEVCEAQSEKELLLNWSAFVGQTHCTWIIGYNINGFDWGYMLDRAELLGCATEFKRMNWACRERPCGTVRKMEVTTQQRGTVTDYSLQLDATINCDLYPFMREKFKLTSYSLNAVSKHVLGEEEGKVDLPYKEMFRLFHHGERGAANATIGRYCLQDCALPLRLFRKLCVATETFELSKLCGVPATTLLNKGQSIRIFTKFSEYTEKEQYVHPPVFQHTEDDRPLEGAYVHDCRAGFYDHSFPVCVLDFASLYPSIIIAYNLSPETLLQGDSGQAFLHEHGLVEGQDYFKVAIGTEQPVWFLSAAYMGRPAMLPAMLQDLLESRRATKREMKAVDDQQSFQYKLLDAQQLAKKVICNSAYGYMAMKIQSATLRCRQVAAATTYYGRTLIKETERLALAFDSDCICVYGDTDSVMIGFPRSTIADAIARANAIAAHATAQFRSPLVLEFEDCLCPSLFLSKKRYVGCYRTQDGAYDVAKRKERGLQIVRRDNCHLTRTVLRQSLECLLSVGGHASKVWSIVMDTVERMLNGDIPLDDFIISKTVSKNEYSTRAPHVAVYEKLKERLGTAAPALGSRIPYVVTAGDAAAVWERAEDPVYARAKSLPVDYHYYLRNQLMTPIAEMLKWSSKTPYSWEPLLKKVIQRRSLDIRKLDKSQADISTWFQPQPRRRKLAE